MPSDLERAPPAARLDAMTKVCIAGVGAIGGLFAGWLASRVPARDVEVCALARGSTLKALEEKGLRVDSEDATTQVRVPASDDPAVLGVQDLVVLAVKAPALPAVAPKIAALLGPDTAVLMAMNGVPWWFFDRPGAPEAGLRLEAVDPGGIVRASIPTRHVVGCVVHAGASVVEPGHVRHGKGRGLIIGEPAGGRSPRLDAIGSLLGRAGFEVTASDHIQRDIWFKLWGNLTLNPVSALTGATADRILEDPLLRSFCIAVMDEAQLVGERIGCRIEQTPEERLEVARRLGAFKTSMLQDVEAGRPLEIDALVSVVRDIAVHVGIATPNIDALLGLVRLMARVRGLA
jgi:2-dehydropantoate 2-reductase